MRLSAKLQPPGDDNHIRPADELPAGKRRVDAFGAKLGGIDRPTHLGVDDRYVGIGA